MLVTVLFNGVGDLMSHDHCQHSTQKNHEYLPVPGTRTWAGQRETIPERPGARWTSNRYDLHFP